MRAFRETAGARVVPKTRPPRSQGKAVSHYLIRSENTMKAASATPTRLMTTEPTTGSTGDLQEQIRRRAFELYGRADGYDLADWLQAESEVTQRKSKAMAA
jgi:hypothetical protein